MSQNMDPRFQSALDTFCQRAQALVDNHYVAHPGTAAPKLQQRHGRRYVLLMEVHYSGPENQNRHESAFCFVDKTTGHVLKPDTYRKPHPTPRGTIYSDKLEGVDALGALYLNTGKPHTHTGPDHIVRVEEK